jgi:quinol monooxygenase YgiN
MIALIVVALGTLVAAVGTGVLAARTSRTPRIYFFSWTVAIFGLAIGLGAAAIGLLAGYGHLLFRAMEFGTQLLAPLALCLALVEVAGRSLAARFAMRLAVSGLAVIAVVILGTDPLNPNYTFSTAWPDPSVVYQLAPLAVLGVLALFTAVTAVAAFGVTAVRSSRDQLAREESRPVLIVAVAALLLALPGLTWLVRKGAGITLPLGGKDVFAASCLFAAALIWYAAKISIGRDLSNVSPQAAASGEADDDWDDHDHDGAGYRPARTASYRSYETGEFDSYREPDSEIRYPGLAELAAEPGHSGHYEDDDLDSLADSGVYFGGEPTSYEYDSRQFDQPAEVQSGPLFGQITIYTLVEGRAEDFDRLTEWVVGQVQDREPDTLVYIAHAVPTAPMQRILYEVYRSRSAHEDHLARGYVMTYEAEQRPLVLAANVIELGLQQAKVSPLPSISAFSDILSESGIDLTGVTRSSRAGVDRSEHQYGPDESGFVDPRYGPARLEPSGYQRPLPERPLPERARYEQPGYHQESYQQEFYDHGAPHDHGASYEQGAPYEQGVPYENGHYEQPPYGQPEYGQPEYGQPEYQEPGYEEPGYGPPDRGQLDRGQLDRGEPDYEQPGYHGPGYRGSGYQGPGYEAPEPDRPYRGGWAEIRGQDSRRR